MNSRQRQTPTRKATRQQRDGEREQPRPGVAAVRTPARAGGRSPSVKKTTRRKIETASTGPSARLASAARMPEARGRRERSRTTKSAIVSRSRSGRTTSSTTAGSLATSMNAFGGQPLAAVRPRARERVVLDQEGGRQVQAERRRRRSAPTRTRSPVPAAGRSGRRGSGRPATTSTRPSGDAADAVQPRVRRLRERRHEPAEAGQDQQPAEPRRRPRRARRRARPRSGRRPSPPGPRPAGRRTPPSSRTASSRPRACRRRRLPRRWPRRSGDWWRSGERGGPQARAPAFHDGHRGRHHRDFYRVRDGRLIPGG